MPRKPKKVTKLKGSRYYAHGYSNRTRGAGNRGGRGNAGSGKRADHKKPTFINQRRQFGKHGFKSIPQRFHKKEVKTISIAQLEEFANYYLEKGIFEKKNDIIFADLSKLDVKKLLANGDVKHKWNIKVAKASENAIEKISAAGGQVILEE